MRERTQGLLSHENWTGYTMYDLTGTSTYNDVDYARAEFTVPDIYDPTGTLCTGTNIAGCVLSIWSGLSRNSDGHTQMAQTGVTAECKDQNCAGGETYEMFTEMVGTAHQIHCSSTVKPGHKVVAVTSHSQSESTHDLSMWTYNYDTRKTCSTTKSSSTDSSYRLRYAQYIAERPSSGSNLERLPGFADFNIEGMIKRSNGLYEGISTPYNAGDYYVNWMYDDGTISGTLNVKSDQVLSNDKFLVDYQTSTGT